jgi:methanogenic corrinoid protein MtbC1
MSQSLGSLRELRPAVAQLLQSFARFDTARANAVMTEALRNHGVENVCIGLVQPAVIRISELWSKSELSNPEERFGLNYLRSFMFAVFQSTQEPMGAPFAVVGCAPNETSDFGALLLAVLWRRAGLRVAYLGRGIDGDQLMEEPWPVTPTIIALTATMQQRIRALARIGKKLSEQPQPQTIFAYWGPIFVRNPDLRRKLGGIYLGDDAATATRHVRQLLNLDGYGE